MRAVSGRLHPPSAGLGLAIAKTIAAGHGGTITVTSREGHGNTLHGLAAVRAMTSLDAG
jgi:signal transduction histidine kinase